MNTDDRMRKRIVFTLAITAPGYTFGVVFLLSKGIGSQAYYEAVAQIIPILVLGLLIEARYLSVREGMIDRLAPPGYTTLLKRVSWIYPVLTFSLVLLAEAIALVALAREDASPLYLQITAGGLSAGVLALVISLVAADTATSGSSGTRDDHDGAGKSGRISSPVE